MPAGRKWPEDFWPQGKDLRRGLVHVEVPSLNVPALQMKEEVNNGLQVAALVKQQQAIVQESPEVPVSSSVERGSQTANVEQVLDVPVLHMLDEDDIFIVLIEQVTVQQTPDVQSTVVVCSVRTRASDRSSGASAAASRRTDCGLSQCYKIAFNSEMLALPRLALQLHGWTLRKGILTVSSNFSQAPKKCEG